MEFASLALCASTVSLSSSRSLSLSLCLSFSLSLSLSLSLWQAFCCTAFVSSRASSRLQFLLVCRQSGVLAIMVDSTGHDDEQVQLEDKEPTRRAIWCHLALFLWLGGFHVNTVVAVVCLANLRSAWAIT